MQIYSLHVFYRKKKSRKNGVIKVEYFESIARQGNVYNYIYLLHHKSLLTKKFKITEKKTTETETILFE